MTIIDRLKTVLEDLWIKTESGEEITPETPLQALTMDSLDNLELVVAIEDIFNIEISDEAAENWKTVGNIVAFIESVAEEDDW